MKTIKFCFTLLAPILLLCSSCDEEVVMPEPIKDQVSISLDEGATGVICLDEVYDLTAVDSAAILYQTEIGVVVNDNNTCVEITNDTDGFINDTAIVVHCENSICDTTIIIVANCQDCEAHDCSPYSASNTNAVKNDNWSVVNEEDTFNGLLLTPGEAGGGVWEVSLTTDAPAVPWLTIDNDVNASGAIVAGSSAGTNSEQTKKASFLGYPNMAYTIKAKTFFAGVTDEYPWDYSISYSFSGRMDCYEPNDVFSQAKSIPKDELIEAYAIAGYRDYFVGANDDHTYDWYKFIVTEPSTIRAELLTSPSDVLLGFKIFSSETNQLLTPATATSGGLNDPGRLYYIETSGDLQPGTYYLQVHPFTADRSIINDEPTPDHWNTKYELKVTVQ